MKKTYPRVTELFKADIANGVGVRGIVRKTGLNSNTIANYSDGITEPTQASLEKISAAYGKSVAWLRGDTDNYTAPDLAIAVAALSPVQQKMRDRMMELSDSQIELLLQVSEQFVSKHE